MRKRFFVGIFAINLLVGCQANYIRDVGDAANLLI
ncbi:TPA: colicin release lysis protein [Escherichia coli]|nr:colicin release lysis protein [Escherichia coli]